MRKNLILPIIGIILLGAFLRLYGISSQPPLSDEVGVVFSAVHYVENGQFGPTMWYHPNLRNVLIYWVGEVFGYGPYALRGMSLITGILSIPVMYILLYLLTKNNTASLLASFFLSIEQVHITFSRQAIQETWTTFFFLLGTLFAVLYYKKDKPLMLIFSGIAFGLGMASKFHAFFPLLTCLIAGLYLLWKERSFSRGIFAVSCLVFIPAIIYLLTYIPWFERGYGITDWIQMQKALLVKMMTHRGNPMDQVIDTQAWQWFLRPMGYANFVFFEGKPFVTISFSNPFVWLLVLPSTAFILRNIIKKTLYPPVSPLIKLIVGHKYGWTRENSSLMEKDIRNSPLEKGDKGGCKEHIEEESKPQPPPPPLLRGNHTTIPRRMLWPAELEGKDQLIKKGIEKDVSKGETEWGVAFILLLFLVSYLPLALSPRPIWLLSSLATIPFAFMIVALAVTQLAKAVRWGRKALVTYIIVVILSSSSLYPMAIGKAKFFDYLSPVVERYRPPFERMH